MVEIKMHELWQLLRKNAINEDPETAAEFEADVWNVCNYCLSLSVTIRDTFPTFTLHDETHIYNVMSNMLKLLGEHKQCLSRNECALLILAACCHDIGMAVSNEELVYFQHCPNCLVEYLETHPSDFNIVYPYSMYDVPNITTEVIQHYVRANHHTRVRNFMLNLNWPVTLGKYISVDELIEVCQSHGEDTSKIKHIRITSSDLDLYLCAVLLRLGDILDFDITRAPDSIYHYINFEGLDGDENEKSHLEWDKHRASRGFVFLSDKHRTLLYRAECTTIQVEQATMTYLDWVDNELLLCGEMIRYMDSRWHSLLLPSKIVRQITAKGYISGEYKITLAKKQILELLVGQDIYKDSFVFVRELLQNAIDAVRSRKQLDNNIPRNWKPQINIKTWQDSEGFYWFRIEDNGIGMTELMIREFFLKVGNSYYQSEQFKFDMVHAQADINYKPISRFGIGLLSCFMGDLHGTRVEISTKHFPEFGKYYPAYRLSIHGINGYYYLASDTEQRTVAPDLPDNKNSYQKFISNPGTIIAVRINPYQISEQTGIFNGFKEIVDRYIFYPEVAIYYEGTDGTYNYPTEYDFMESVHKLIPRSTNGVCTALEEILLSDKEFQKLKEIFPNILWKERPHFALYCFALDYYSDSPLISGASFHVKVLGEGNWQCINLLKKYVPTITLSLPTTSDGRNILPSHLIKFEVTVELPTEIKIELQNRIQSELRIQGLIENEKLTPSEIKAAIQRLKITQLTQVSLEEIHVYQSVNTKYSCILGLDNFRHFPWIDKWLFFNHLPTIADFSSAIVHNGIYVGISSNLMCNKCTAQNSIVLLKDKYRPELDIARNHIKGYTLETRYYLEALRAKIANQLRVSFSSFLENSDDMLIPEKSYLDIFENNPALLSAMQFITTIGPMSINDIERTLQEGKDIQVILTYNTLGSIAILAWKFKLSIGNICWETTPVNVAKKEYAFIEEQLLDFPPALFLPTVDNNLIAFGTLKGGIAPILATYNIGHPFSMWLIRNREVLQKRVPILYRNIISALRHTHILGLHGWHNTIEIINSILSTLRCHPSLNIEIIQDLTLEDFVVEEDQP